MHVGSAFVLNRPYRALLAWDSQAGKDPFIEEEFAQNLKRFDFIHNFVLIWLRSWDALDRRVVYAGKRAQCGPGNDWG